MRYKDLRYKFDINEIFHDKLVEEYLGDVLCWLYMNLPTSHFRYNHTEKIIRFKHKEDRMGFKLRWS